MLESSSNQEIVYDHPSKTYIGVRFLLLGFEPIHKDKVRTKLIEGGGIDVAEYGPSCTHVIVDRLVYDDSSCVSARNDGKTIINSLWVDHSFDVGMPVDPTSIMYRPPKDLGGIPGAKSLIVCLTGYQRHDRDDIMTLVGLMGAHFSKPLVANKVTHLICYKFEGEKYVLAKKMKKIKLVNHRWLEDCLRAWEILPEANYAKSGYELEMMEAEAKDSEEEPDNATPKQGESKIYASPGGFQTETTSSHLALRLKPEISVNQLESSSSKSWPNFASINDMVLTTGRERTAQVPQVPETCQKPPEVLNICHQGNLGNASCSEPSNQCDKALSPPSRSRKMSPYSDESKLNAISYSKKAPRRATPQKYSGQTGSSLSSGRFDVSSGKAKDESQNNSLSVKTSSGTGLGLEEGNGGSGLSKTGNKLNAQMLECPSSLSRPEGLKPTSLINSSLIGRKALSLSKNAHCLDGAPVLDTAQTSPGILTNCGASASIKPGIAAATVIAAENRQVDNTDKAPQSDDFGIKVGSSSRSDTDDVVISKLGHVIGNTERQIEMQNASSSPRAKKLKVKKHTSPANLDLLKEESCGSHLKPQMTKITGDKTLGARPTSATRKNTNQKGSIYLKAALQNDVVINLIGGPETARRSRESNVENENAITGDETEAPEDKEENDEVAVGQGESTGVQGTSGIDVMREEKSGMQCVNDNMDSCTFVKHGDATDDMKHLEKVAEEKVDIVKKRPFGQTGKKTAPASRKCLKSRKGSKDDEVKIGKDNQNTEKLDEERILDPVGKAKAVAMPDLETSVEVEKENKPFSIGDENTVHNKLQKLKGSSKSIKPSEEIDAKAAEKDVGLKQIERITKTHSEPMLFILSGHKLQRKEYQLVIRRLRGRVCRDSSHQWSYQATHFIVPDPIRRTEKLFAAAVSGRWILKTDYLTASNQAGNFLEEEPFEWHNNGLSEDGAISLQAPRKWRQLRERTGHGAFYGMHIIIYGECIAPSLDTLKRVVKAGDGTILATSPPYSRFLDSGVDFAIVSPGMPCVDIWVQEFLKHEIPCVSADYLVEYVCKPGYSLEKHVLYNTHAWAENSLKKLLNKTVAEPTTLDDSGNNDLPCQVCGSRDRCDIMLICGDENGSIGCGVGMHIDCCDPPLEEVPEEDWFCPKCCTSKNSKNPRKSIKKRSSAAKRGNE